MKMGKNSQLKSPFPLLKSVRVTIRQRNGEIFGLKAQLIGKEKPFIKNRKIVVRLFDCCYPSLHSYLVRKEQSTSSNF
jgi:hypothetical protein